MGKKLITKLIIGIIVLFIISVINLYNAKYLNIIYKYYYIKQIIYFIFGFVIIYILSKTNINFIFKYSKLIYILNLLLLFIVLFIGKEINGTKAWLDLKICTFQPSETMKFALNLLLINESMKNEKKNINILKLIIYTLIPSFLVFIEPDTGAIIFYLLILMVIISYKKINYKTYIKFSIVSVVLIISFMMLYKYNSNIIIKLFGSNIIYRIERITNFKNNNYQLELALTSIYANKFIRNGFNNILLYIPEATTDFILAFSIGNFGIIVLILTLFSYYLILSSLIKISNNLNKKTNYLTISFIIMFYIQIIINMLMNIGLIPIIGITLPFLSYGGSSILLYFIYIGIIINSFKKAY